MSDVLKQLVLENTAVVNKRIEFLTNKLSEINAQMLKGDVTLDKVVLLREMKDDIVNQLNRLRYEVTNG